MPQPSISILALKNLNRKHIQISKTSDQINLYYSDTIDQKTKRIPLYVKTNCWTCPFGRDDQGKLLAIIHDDEYFKIEELDSFGRDVCRYFLKDSGEEIPNNSDDLPYKSIIQQVDGLDVLNLSMNDATRVFDNNGVKLTPEQINQWTAGQFSANFLLTLNLRIWTADDGGSITNGKFYWSVQPVQIKINKYCTLPEGCQIFENEELLTKELDVRQESQIKVQVRDEEPVTDFDPDVNELLD